MLKESVKIRTYGKEEISHLIQDIAFELGITWYGGSIEYIENAIFGFNPPE